MIILIFTWLGKNSYHAFVINGVSLILYNDKKNKLRDNKKLLILNIVS